uniref:Uncharacterized protein n=1 Tax=Haemonchus placei TaxID=6290 RepID=A0A0N4W6Q7_HAEPC
MYAICQIDIFTQIPCWSQKWSITFAFVFSAMTSSL